MTDSTRAAMAAGVAAGYLLGRTKKAKLALAVAFLAAGRRMPRHPGELLSEGLHKVGPSEQFSHLSERLRGELRSSGQSAASAALHRGCDRVADALAAGNRVLSGGGDENEEPDESSEQAGKQEPDAPGREAERERSSQRGQREEPDQQARQDAPGQREGQGDEPSGKGGETAGASARRRSRPPRQPLRPRTPTATRSRSREEEEQS